MICLKIYIVRYKVKKESQAGDGSNLDAISMTKINKIHLNIEIE
ncbi:Uncharacterized protein ChrSV_2968 [Chromobacterium vaccinii]|nr:Uncharacterized protein ChrSW_2968 [Chromobacterium vaccinii]QND90425.1 Uncharacterized protein ChrSV_2968 [Chromobacterium vaccinii]